MAKKLAKEQEEKEKERQSRKEILRARKEAEQTKKIRLAVAGVGGLLLLVFLVAIVNELFIAPNQTIATVNGEAITLHQWQDRVRFERSQRIISLENQFEAFGGDVGIIQQFSQNTMIELLETETLGENTLNLMIDEMIVRQEAEKRGLTVTDADLDEEIASLFNYFDGQSPTPVPTPTETIVPTPSLTPIPTPVITDVVPTNTPFPTPTLGPPATAQPTATPVSQESYEEQLGEVLAQFRDLGVDEDIFREVIRSRMYSERLGEELAKENELPTEAPHASIFLISADTEEDANEVMALIQESDYLTIWNTIRSRVTNPDISDTITATELLWRTQDNIESTLGVSAAEIAFSLPLNVPSSPINQEIDAETTRYHILQVSGREVRALSEAVLENAKSQLVTEFVDQEAAIGVEMTEAWRNRIPTQPELDPKFLAQPTATPVISTQEE